MIYNFIDIKEITVSNKNLIVKSNYVIDTIIEITKRSQGLSALVL